MSCCEMPECGRTDGLKVVRDPDSNLLEMCRRCRSQWPVDEVAA